MKALPVCALLLSTLLGCRSTSDAPDMGGEDLPPMINLNADAGAEQPADQPQLAARELPAEIPPQSVEQPASAAAAISSATASAALPNPVEQDTVDPIDDVPPPPGDEPEQPEEPARKLEVRYAWVQPALRGDEWHAAHPLQRRDGEPTMVSQALISTFLTNGQKARTILATPLEVEWSGTAFAFDGRQDPLPLLVPEFEEDRLTHGESVVQFFDLRELEEDLKHGTVLLLDIQLEDGSYLEVPQNAFELSSKDDMLVVHTYNMSTGSLRLGVHRRSDNVRVWKLYLEPPPR